MKRAFDEISDDEWSNHSFKPSRVFGKSQTEAPKPPPPIESFAYRSQKIEVSDESSDDCVVIMETQKNFMENLEDDDVELEEVKSSTVVGRGRRFVVDDDESEEELAQFCDIRSTSEEEDKEDEDDVVGKALHKCAKLSSELKRELYGSAVSTCERYAEVEASSVRIVTQDDINAACKAEDSDFEPVLKPYQLVGVNFLLFLYRKGVGGAILADEMGLGKTIQAITFLMLLKHLNNDWGPHLIVCPASVLENWERELKKWCPSFSVLQYHGAGRSAYSKELNSLAKAGLPPPFNVLLVCYSLFERHSAQQKDERRILKRWQWSCVLMDEAHALKDKNSYRWKNLMSLARNAKQRLMLTGTPLQNDLHVRAPRLLKGASTSGYGASSSSPIILDWAPLLHSFNGPGIFSGETLGLENCLLLFVGYMHLSREMFSWLLCIGIFRRDRGSKKLKNDSVYCLTLENLGLHLTELWSMLEFMMPNLFATEDVDLKKLLTAENNALVSHMKFILGPFILRRLKSDVMQQLVPKIQEVQYVIMEKKQEDAYKDAIEEYRNALSARVDRNSKSNLNNIYGAIPRRQISNYFVQFRKIANHPLLIRRIYDDEDVSRFAEKLHPLGAFGHECSVERVVDELKNYNDFSIHRLLLSYGISDRKGVLSDKEVLVSAKCQALAQLLPSLKQAGHRVLIFSQWTSMLDILEWTLDVIGFTYRRLDGSTPVAERQTIVDTFNNDTSIFACLLSTRAGGQGLNLTGADTVVIHDMDFNPQIDRQAEDRCHRIGQTRPVTIYRLVTKGTVDENVYEIAKRKLVLDAAVLESGVEIDNDGESANKTMGEILSAILLG